MSKVQIDISNPFPGLRSFKESEAHLFFGREEQVDQLLLRLKKHRFTALIGMSGSGKSSLVKAGLVPALKSGFMTQIGANWKISLCRAGNNPIRNLAHSIYECGIIQLEKEQEINTQISILQAKLERSEHALVELITQHKTEQADNILLVIDQFEEVLEHERYGEEGYARSMAFVNLLLHTINTHSPGIHLVLTMRSDYIDYCADFPGLIDIINRAQYILPPMTRKQLYLAVTGPVKVGGSNLTPMLGQQVINDLDKHHNQLPILQHAMMRMWEYWKEQGNGHPYLEPHHYETIGTMDNALSLHAEEAYYELDEAKRSIARKIFQTITEYRSVGTGVRRATSLYDIAKISGVSMEQVEEVVSHFAMNKRSFLIVSHLKYSNGSLERGQKIIVDISHESIMQLWSRLNGWMKEEADAAQIYLRLCQAAANYEQGKVGLLNDPELTLSVQWHEQYRPNMYWANRYDPSYIRAMTFLKKSREEKEWQKQQDALKQQKRLKNSKRVAIVMAVLFILSLVLLLTTFLSQIESQKNLKIAQVEKVKADQSRQEALEQRRKAIQSEKRAIAEREKAIENEQIAIEQSRTAKESARLTQIQKEKATKNENQAKRQAIMAAEQRMEALRQTAIANQKRKDAEKQEQIANEQKEKLEAIRMRFVVNTIVDNSMRMMEQQKEKVALALQAYAFHQKFRGGDLGQNVFHALLSAGKHIEPQIIHSFDDQLSPANTIKYDPNGQYWMAAGKDGQVIMRDLDGRQLQSFKACSSWDCDARDLAINRKHPIFAVAHANGILRVWEIEGGRHVKLKGHKGIIRALEFTPNSQWLISGGIDGKVGCWKVDENAQVQHHQWLDLQEGVADIIPATNANAVLIATRNGNIYQYNAQKHQLNLLASGMGEILTIERVPSQEVIVAGNSNGKVIILDINNKVKQEYAEHKSGVTGVSISPDGQLIATSSYDQTVKIFRRKQMTDSPIVLKSNYWIHHVSFSIDGNFVLFSLENHKIMKVPIQAAVIVEALCQQEGSDQVNAKLWNKIVGEGIQQLSICKEDE